MTTQAMSEGTSNESSSPKLLDFPTDILHKILVQIDPLQILKSLRLVSKKFLDVSSHTKLWRDICRKDWQLKDSDLESPDFAQLTWMKEWQTMYRYWKKITSNSFNLSEAAENIEIDNNGVVKYTPTTTVSSHSATSDSPSGITPTNQPAATKVLEGPIQAVQPFFPLPYGCGNMGYFEVTITSGTPSLVIGAAQKGYDKQVPGWAPHSVGFYTADGSLFRESVIPREFGDACKIGDVIGCGVCFDKAELFFTRNGQLVGGMPLLCSAKLLVPTLGFLHGSSEMTFKVNFGAEPFKFDLIEHQRLVATLDRMEKSPFATIPYSIRVEKLQSAESDKKEESVSTNSSLPDASSSDLTLEDYHQAILQCQAMIQLFASTEKHPTSQLETKMRLIAKQNFSGQIDPNQNPEKLRQELQEAYKHLAGTLCRHVIQKIADEYKKKAERPVDDEHLILERLVHQFALVLDDKIPSDHPVMAYHLNQLKQSLCEHLDIPSISKETDPEALRQKIINQFSFSIYMTIKQRQARLTQKSKIIVLNPLTLSEKMNDSTNQQHKKKKTGEILKEGELKRPRILDKQLLEKDLATLKDSSKSANHPTVVAALWRVINSHGFEGNIPFDNLEVMRRQAVELLTRDKEELHLYEQYKLLFTLKRHVAVLRNKEYLFDSDSLVQDIIKLWYPIAQENNLEIFKGSSPRDDLAAFLEEQYKQTENYIKSLLSATHNESASRQKLKKKRVAMDHNGQAESNGDNSTPSLLVPTFILGATVLAGFFVIRSLVQRQK
jgi:hypothetical protein